MAITADKLDSAVLAILNQFSGERTAAIADWSADINQRLGGLPSHAETTSSLKRLHRDGILGLKKWSEKHGGWWEYLGDETHDEPFFHHASFVVTVTDLGRRYWDVPRGKIGFQQSA